MTAASDRSKIEMPFVEAVDECATRASLRRKYSDLIRSAISATSASTDSHPSQAFEECQELECSTTGRHVRSSTRNSRLHGISSSVSTREIVGP